MASTGTTSGNLHVYRSLSFHSRADAGAGSIAGEPHLILSLTYDIDGEIAEVLAESRHRFADCSPLSLQALIREKERRPLEAILTGARDAEIARGTICNTVDSLVRDCVWIEGLKNLNVNVLLEISREQDSSDGMEAEDEFLRGERRMDLLEKGVYMSAAAAAAAPAEDDEEFCAICLDEFRAGEEVAWTPCVHRFHEGCIGRWFESSGLCPLCRFEIEPF